MAGEEPPPRSSQRPTSKPAKWAAGQRRKLVRKSATSRSQPKLDVPGTNLASSSNFSLVEDADSIGWAEEGAADTSAEALGGPETPSTSFSKLTTDSPSSKIDAKKKSMFSRKGRAGRAPSKLPTPTSPLPGDFSKRSPKAAKVLGVSLADSDGDDDDEDDGKDCAEFESLEEYDDVYDDEPDVDTTNTGQTKESELRANLSNKQPATVMGRLRKTLSKPALILKQGEAEKKSSFVEQGLDDLDAPIVADAPPGRRSKNLLKSLRWQDLMPSLQARSDSSQTEYEQIEDEESLPVPQKTSRSQYGPSHYSRTSFPALARAAWQKKPQTRPKLAKPFETMTPITESTRSNSTDPSDDLPLSTPHADSAQKVQRVYTNKWYSRSFVQPGSSPYESRPDALSSPDKDDTKERAGKGAMRKPESIDLPQAANTVPGTTSCCCSPLCHIPTSRLEGYLRNLELAIGRTNATTDKMDEHVARLKEDSKKFDRGFAEIQTGINETDAEIEALMSDADAKIKTIFSEADRILKTDYSGISGQPAGTLEKATDKVKDEEKTGYDSDDSDFVEPTIHEARYVTITRARPVLVDIPPRRKRNEVRIQSPKEGMGQPTTSIVQAGNKARESRHAVNAPTNLALRKKTFHGSAPPQQNYPISKPLKTASNDSKLGVSAEKKLHRPPKLPQKSSHRRYHCIDGGHKFVPINLKKASDNVQISNLEISPYLRTPAGNKQHVSVPVHCELCNRDAGAEIWQCEISVCSLTVCYFCAQNMQADSDARAVESWNNRF